MNMYLFKSELKDEKLMETVASHQQRQTVADDSIAFFYCFKVRSDFIGKLHTVQWQLSGEAATDDSYGDTDPAGEPI